MRAGTGKRRWIPLEQQPLHAAACCTSIVRTGVRLLRGMAAERISMAIIVHIIQKDVSYGIHLWGGNDGAMSAVYRTRHSLALSDGGDASFLGTALSLLPSVVSLPRLLSSSSLGCWNPVIRGRTRRLRTASGPVNAMRISSAFEGCVGAYSEKSGCRAKAMRAASIRMSLMGAHASSAIGSLSLSLYIRLSSALRQHTWSGRGQDFAGPKTCVCAQ